MSQGIPLHVPFHIMNIKAHMVLHAQDTLILASKSFTHFSLYQGNWLILAILVSIHNNIYKNRKKLVTFKISYLN